MSVWERETINGKVEEDDVRNWRGVDLCSTVETRPDEERGAWKARSNREKAFNTRNNGSFRLVERHERYNKVVIIVNVVRRKRDVEDSVDKGIGVWERDGEIEVHVGKREEFGVAKT